MTQEGLEPVDVENNRRTFLEALRSGDYPKGPFVSGQDAPPPEATGFCAVGLPYTLLLNNKGPVMALRRVLGLTRAQISKIQNEWNDSPLSFREIADLIEKEMFLAKRKSGPLRDRFC